MWLIIIGYLVGIIPGIAYFKERAKKADRKIAFTLNTGVIIYSYPILNLFWSFFFIDLIKIIFFYLSLNSQVYWLSCGLFLGYCLPFYSLKNKNLWPLALALFLTINFGFGILTGIVSMFLAFYFPKKIMNSLLLIFCFSFTLFTWVMNYELAMVGITFCFVLYAGLSYLNVLQEPGNNIP